MKGFIFTFDIAVGIALVFLILIFSFSYYSQSKDTGIEDISLLRTSNDIIAVLDYTGALDTMDSNYIEAKLNEIMPENMNMSLTIYGYNPDLALEKIIHVGGDIGEDYIRGKWAFSNKVVNRRFYNIVEYKAGFR